MIDSAPPIVLVHGLGSTFDHNWRRSGWVDLLEAEGRTVLPFDLPGHGTAEPLTGDDSAGRRLVGLARTVGPLDIVGFSAGAVATLEALLLEPTLFRRAALLGIGDGMWRPANGAEPDVRSGAVARLMSRLIESAGNDAESVNAYAGNIVPRPMSEIASIGLPVMLVIGDDDPVGPAHTLSATIPHAELTTLPRTDHFATTSSYRCQEAVLDFLLREVPATC